LYYEPLCYQLFPETENSKMWGHENILFTFISIIIKKCYKFWKLDLEPEPGYSIFYLCSNIVFLIVILIFFYLFYLFYLCYNYFAKNINIKKIKK